METPVAPPYTNPLSGIPGEPPRAWAPPASAPTPPEPSTPTPSPRPRGRGRFGAGVLVGVALTGAAVGGYAIGQQDDQSAAVTTVASPVVAQDVSASIGSISDLVDAVRPSVVSVRQEVTQTGPLGQTSRGQAAGTGFVLSADGYIVTNNHVIAEGDSPVVTFADGTTEPATIVAGDPSRDLAVLKVDRADLVPLAVGDSDALRLGDQLIAVGYALDLNGEPSVTSGILSAKNRTITAENGAQLVNLLQTDTAINPGNSGGPLLNARGEVVGINTAIAGGAENIGFAIAITPVMDVIDSLRDGSVPDRALMGVTTQPTGEGLGVEIVEIADGSGAADSDLRVGDVIVAVDDNDITDPTSLGAAVATYQPGDTVTVTIERDGSTRDVQVTLGTRPT
ncbi:MAG TPA: trypsin-like peptidase domain-containing protein [Ilumatobacteraceae bacterium]|nr:trypsin-like peptidase domain-containing protein [Ilumatobacteraceae bacterium]